MKRTRLNCEVEFHLFSMHLDAGFSSVEFFVNLFAIATPYRDGHLFHYRYYKFNSPEAKPIREFDFLWAGLWLGKLLGE